MDTLVRDTRHAVRALLRAPGFALVTVLMLALGIGAATTIFSVVYGVLLKPLPYWDADQLVRIWQVSSRSTRGAFSDPNFDDLKAESRSFERLAHYGQGGMVPVLGREGPIRVQASIASYDLFALLGVQPIRGREFLPEEQQVGGPPAVLVSYEYWQRHLGGDPDLSKNTFTIQDRVYTVVGVLPPRFDFPEQADIWLPRGLWPKTPSRTGHNLSVVGRLKDGVTLEQAHQELSAIARRLKAQYGDDTWMADAAVVPLRDDIVGRVRPALLVMLGAAGLLLLIACANVTNLLLARAASRRRELAVRLALGAGRRRLARHFLSEALVLSLVGGALGVLLALWGMDAFLSLKPGQLPRAHEVGVTWVVLAFALSVSVLAAAALGLVVALHATGQDVRASLAEQQRTQAGGSASDRLRGVLVASQVALTLVLLVSAGLVGRSFLRLLAVDPGFRTENGVVMNVAFNSPRGQEAARLGRFHEDMIRRLSTIPGVTHAGGVSSFPLGEGGSNGLFVIMSRPDEISSIEDFRRLIRDSSRTALAQFRIASEGYFRAMDIPLVRGRLFDERDAPGPVHAALINEALAKARWPDQDPIGQLIQFGNMDGDLRPFTVVGIVGDTREQSLEMEPQPTFYGNVHQRPASAGGFTYVMSISTDPAPVISSARGVLRELDPSIPPILDTFEQRFAAVRADRRFNVLLLGVFAGAALLLAVMGIYGVTSYSVAQRRREIGIRIALGAQRGDVLRAVLRQGVVLATIGIVAGLAGAFALTRFISSLLYGVSTIDPITFLGVPALLLAVALLASYLPARRAARVDPVVTLRSE
ncbi:MAG: ABC transporter permease [Gemmatimonadaceae bacterium]